MAKLLPTSLVPILAALCAATPLHAQEAPVFASDPLEAATLERITGREDHAQIATADQAATVTRNSVGDNVSTGEARIADNAFQNLSGLSVLNVNTGNNVAINAAMNVTIAIAPAP